MELEKVGVAGCGLMGHGIAQASAEAGYEVVVSEVSQEALDKGIGKIEKQLAKGVEKGKVDQADADAVLGRIQGTLDTGDFADCDLVIEAVTEDLPTKLELWKELDGIVKEDACFATNTSSLPVAEQAAATGRPGRFLGLHFFNPVQRMPLLEVIEADDTETGTMEVGVGFGESLGDKVNVEVDGGIGPSTIAGAAAAGANVLIAGSALYRDPEGLKHAVDDLRARATAAFSA